MNQEKEVNLLLENLINTDPATVKSVTVNNIYEILLKKNCLSMVSAIIITNLENNFSYEINPSAIDTYEMLVNEIKNFFKLNKKFKEEAKIKLNQLNLFGE